MDRKIVMLLIGIVAIGMFALPNTLAMYSGQHSFVNGTNVDCAKCHGSGDAIGDELNNSDMHSTMDCETCHGFSGTNPNDDTTGHAATTGVTCLGCHTNGTYDSGSDDGNGVSVQAELQAGAHEPFWNSTNITDQDDVCIACHTNVGVSNAIAVGTYETNITLANFTYGLS